MLPLPPGAGVTLITLDGQVICGGCVSLTVMVNEQLAGLPAASLTLQVTVVVPFGKVEPAIGAQETVPTFEQLSLAVGVEYITDAEHCPAAAGTLIFDGQVIEGACVSLTVTVNEQLP